MGNEINEKEKPRYGLNRASKKKNKVLVASSTYSGMDYCFQQFINHLKAIDYDDFDILIIDNSKSKNFFRKIKDISQIKVIHDDINEEKNILRLISSRNKILDYAVKKGYNYLLMMDSDVIVNPNILSQLLSYNKDVCSGLYFSYFKTNKGIEFLPVCYKNLEEKYFDLYTKFFPKLNPKILRRHLTLEEVKSRKLLEVAIPSNGCVLLSRKAFNSGVRYALSDVKGATDDLCFYRELREKGFKIYCDTSILCKHLIDGKFDGSDDKHPVFE